MSGLTQPQEAALIATVLSALRLDEGVREFFGAPPRIFDAETERAAFPYAELVSTATNEIASAETPGGEHRLTFAVYARHGGRAAAAEGLDALVRAVQAAELSLPNANIAFAHPVYLDVIRGRRQGVFRGLMRLRIVTEMEPENE